VQARPKGSDVAEKEDIYMWCGAHKAKAAGVQFTRAAILSAPASVLPMLPFYLVIQQLAGGVEKHRLLVWSGLVSHRQVSFLHRSHWLAASWLHA